MKYFQIKEERLLDQANQLQMVNPRQTYNELGLSATGQIDYESNKIMLDFVKAPPIVVTNSIKRLFEDYQADVEAKAVYFNDVAQQKQFVYWWMHLPIAHDCLHPKTTYGINGEIIKPIIQAEHAQMYNIFQIMHQKQEYWIINLAVAESLLRRGLTGFILEEVRSLMRNE
ncbi:hypothetical protein [Listeria goaensis]|uniref:hypothetical protein n=1 Tax=Listeria goaensis TaxID=1649188 RepID=UPI000B592214|nr:hypothetical protein [Listeria goaensis]